jgi:hypothetical protein
VLLLPRHAPGAGLTTIVWQGRGRVCVGGSVDNGGGSFVFYKFYFTVLSKVSLSRVYYLCTMHYALLYVLCTMYR